MKYIIEVTSTRGPQDCRQAISALDAKALEAGFLIERVTPADDEAIQMQLDAAQAQLQQVTDWRDRISTRPASLTRERTE